MHLAASHSPPTAQAGKGRGKAPGALLRARRSEGWGCPPHLGTDLTEQGKQETAAPTAISVRATSPLQTPGCSQ